MKKKIIIGIMIAIVFSILFAVTVSAENEKRLVDVEIGDTIFEPGNTVLKNSLTYVPLRPFCEAMGECEISWDSKTNTATVKANGLEITVKKGSGYICANGRYLFSNSENYIDEDSRIYVPVRALAKAYGAEVIWDTEKFCAKIGAATTPIESGDSFYNKDDLYWLSHIINAESGNEPLIGQIAVGNVVLNRLRQDKALHSIYEVIFDRRYGVQFSPTQLGTIYWDPCQESIIAAKICLEGYSVSDRILYFLDVKAATNLWTVYNCTFVTSIGTHDFYC